MVKQRQIVDLGPDFDQRWKRAPLAARRAFVAELRDLYLMLEDRDERLISRLKKGSLMQPRDFDDDLPLLAPVPSPAPAGQHQRSLFADASPEEDAAPVATGAPDPVEAYSGPGTPSALGKAPAPAFGDVRENPFLPRSILDRLQQTRERVAHLGQRLPDDAPAAPALPALPRNHEESDLERELRLKLGPMVETLIDAQMESIRRELRLRLRLEMDRLIAEHLRK